MSLVMCILNQTEQMSELELNHGEEIQLSVPTSSRLIMNLIELNYYYPEWLSASCRQSTYSW